MATNGSDDEFQRTLAAARVGAEWAWRDLYREAAPRVLRFLRARKALEPEDVLGDVFLQAVKNLHAFQGSAGDFHAWLLTIARNRVVDLARSAARRPISAGPDGMRRLPAADPDPAMAAEHHAAQLRVRKVIDGLSPDQRDVMLLRVLSGLTLAETAGVLGKSVGAVKALQVRAVARIRRQIAEETVPL